MIRVDVRGAEDVKRLLSEIAPNQAINISRATVHGVAGEVAKVVKEKAPKKEGDLRKSFKTKRRRMSYGKIRSDVVSERDWGFYWRFLDRGTSKKHAQPFIVPSVREIEERLPAILREQFVKKFRAAIKRAQRAAQRRAR